MMRRIANLRVDTLTFCLLLLLLPVMCLQPVGTGERYVWGDERGQVEELAGEAEARIDDGLSEAFDLPGPMVQEADAPPSVLNDSADDGAMADETTHEEMSGASEETRMADERASSLVDMLDSGRMRLESGLLAFSAMQDAVPWSVDGEDFPLFDHEAVLERSAELEHGSRNTLVTMGRLEEELARIREEGIWAVLGGTAGATEVQMHQELLEHALYAEARKLLRIRGERKLVDASLALCNAISFQDRRAVSEGALAMNAAAYEVERLCSRFREVIGKAEESVRGIRELVGDAEGVFRVESSIGAAASMLERAESAIGSWYDFLDARFGMEGALTFGRGFDFSLEEAEFVETWGSAIDRFLEEQGDSGEHVPLWGTGRLMAASAFRHKVDPRLCAAVSIIESGGGRNCIRNHNAWGWGAADGDPYALALEWSSFEEAIECWHAGMAESTSGLASACTVSELASIYCSSPAWGETVVDLMERMENLL